MIRATYLVFDGVGFAIIADVLVLSDPVVSSGRFLLDENSVFLGGGVAEAAVAHVEALLLDDLGQAGVSVELGSRQDHAGQRSQEEGLKWKGQVYSCNYSFFILRQIKATNNP